MTHHLKIQPEYFEAVCNGTKRFKVRKDDRAPHYEVGDLLILAEFADGAYTGRVVTVLVDYIYRGELCRDGYCIMSIRK